MRFIIKIKNKKDLKRFLILYDIVELTKKLSKIPIYNLQLKILLWLHAHASFYAIGQKCSQ